MGLYVQNNENRTELQQRIAAELREKAARVQAASEGSSSKIEDTAYMKGIQKTNLAWLWGILTAIVIVAIVALFVKQMMH